MGHLFSPPPLPEAFIDSWVRSLDRAVSPGATCIDPCSFSRMQNFTACLTKAAQGIFKNSEITFASDTVFRTVPSAPGHWEQHLHYQFCICPVKSEGCSKYLQTAAAIGVDLLPTFLQHHSPGGVQFMSWSGSLILESPVL